MKVSLRAGCFFAALATVPGAAHAQAQTPAQAYPTKAIRLVVPFPAGGPVDTLARIVGQRLAENVGQPVIVDNRGGAGGNIGADLVAKSAPDGYTLLISIAATLVINPSLYASMPFDPVKDLAPVALLGTAQFVLVTNPSVAANSVKELIALAKSRSGKMTFASSGNGTEPHLAGELFKSLAGIEIIHVPYKGGAPGVTALLGGEVDMSFQAIISALPHIRANKLKALAVTGARRSSAVPEVPTMIEAGVKGFDVTGWYAILAPSGTPPATIARLNAEIGKVLATPDTRERFERIGTEVATSSPAQLADRISADTARWAKIVKLSGARVE